MSICHEVVETETEWRPWSSHVVREESLHKLRRPKSAAVPIGPPKRAWTAGSERHTHSARSKAVSEPKSAGSTSRVASTLDIHSGPLAMQQQFEEEDESYDKTSTPCTTARDAPTTSVGDQTVSVVQTSGASNTISDPTQSHSSVVLSPAFIFPQYPAYPDIRVNTPTGSTTSVSHSSQPPPELPPPTLPPNDPAVPLIQAIKNEMKRFEKDPTNQK